MRYALRIIGYPLALLILQIMLAERFNENEKATTIMFFMIVTVFEVMSSIMQSPFQLGGRRRRTDP